MPDTGEAREDLFFCCIILVMAKEIFVGGREKGLVILQELLRLGAEIGHAYILQEDDHEVEKFSSRISELCQKHNIPYTVGKSIKSHVNEISAIQPDLITVCGWRTMIPPDIVRLPTYGCIALHESLLPKYRGFAPINWAIINGEKKTGVTLFRLNEQVDDGPIIGQRTILIDANETAYEVYKKTIRVSIELIRKYHNNILKGRIHTKVQNYMLATFTCARIPEDGKIDWTKTTQEIHNLIRGIALPYPGAFCFYKNTKIVIQNSLVPRQKTWTGRIPGRIVAIGVQQGVEVLTGDGSLIITEISVDGISQKADEYFRSIKDTLSS